MTDQHDPHALHDRQATAVQEAVVNLARKLDFPAEVIVEGALKASAIVLLASGASSADVARIFYGFGEAFERPGPPDLEVV